LYDAFPTVQSLTDKQYAMGVTAAKGKLELLEFTPPPLGDDEVFVQVQYCGMCHSDLHTTDGDWGKAKAMPLVPGHEVVGTVKAVGSAVTEFKVGDVVGFGPQRDSCRTCEYCTAGDDNVCDKFTGLYDPKFGGYATT